MSVDHKARTVRTEVASEVIEGLRASVLGTVIAPGDPAYDEARRVWNGIIDRYPALIVQCAGVPDVVEAVRFAREHPMPLSIRGGGHQVAGQRGVRRRARDRPVDDAGRPRRSRGSHGPGAGGCPLGRRRPCDAAVRAGDSWWAGVEDRRGRPHPRRWARAHAPRPWPGLRQPPVGGDRHGRRHRAHRERRPAPGPLLGCPRRRPRPRCGHLIRVRSPSTGARRRRRASRLRD